MMDDIDMMKQLKKCIAKLKKEKAAKDAVMTEAERQEILEDIREGLCEVKLMQQGKMKKRYLKDLIKELRD